MHRVGAIPFDLTDGVWSVLVVTSQTRGRWIFPKGNLEGNESHADAATREAFEEAGVNGTLLTDFPMTAVVSRLTSNGMEKIPVTYYPLLVQKQFKSWPEAKDRERRWVGIKDAKKIVDREDFLDIVKTFKELTPWIGETAEYLQRKRPKAYKFSP